MSVLRKNVRACVPEEERKLENEFMQSFTEEVFVPVFNSKGQEIGSRKETIHKKVPIAKEILRHDGLTVDMFTFAAQQDAGVALKEFNGNFMTPDLDEMSRMGTSATSAVDTMLSDKQNYVEPQNNE